MNFFNISRATQGLVAYLHDWNRSAKISAEPKFVIAYDPRFFSKEFAELAAKVASENGCNAFIFGSPRSVPELSFAVRYLTASSGVMITASHNPPYDNGFKVYFSDGAQVVEPHASGIIKEVNQAESEVYRPLTESARGEIVLLGADVDELYKERVRTLVLRPEVVAAQKNL